MRACVHACLPVLLTVITDLWRAREPSKARTIRHNAAVATAQIRDAYADERFNKDVDRRTGFRTRNMLVVPIRSADAEKRVIAVAQMINKLDGAFTRDEYPR